MLEKTRLYEGGHFTEVGYAGGLSNKESNASVVGRRKLGRGQVETFFF